MKRKLVKTTMKWTKIKVYFRCNAQNTALMHAWLMRLSDDVRIAPTCCHYRKVSYREQIESIAFDTAA